MSFGSLYNQTKTPRYYPAEDVKPVKPSYKVKQNVSVNAFFLLSLPLRIR
jgi:hypothetical protein